MTDIDLAAIEARVDAAYGDGSWDEPEWRDVIALLAEVKELRAKIEAVRTVCDHSPAITNPYPGFKTTYISWIVEALDGAK